MYLNDHSWVGDGNIECTDPKILHDRIVYNLDELILDYFLLMTYPKQLYEVLYFNDSRIELDKFTHYELGQCHTLTFKNDLTTEGIYSVVFYAPALGGLIVYLHQKGNMISDLPGGNMYMKWTENTISKIEHEQVNLLDYNGMDCRFEDDYNFEKCREDYMDEVSISLKILLKVNYSK